MCRAFRGKTGLSMFTLTIRWVTSFAAVYICSFSGTGAVLRVDVGTTVEQKLGTLASIECNVQNLNKATQYLTWMFMDAESVRNNRVSSGSVVQSHYRERFSVTVESRANRVRYRLRITMLRKEDDGTYQCQVMDRFRNIAVAYGMVSISVLYFPYPPSCYPLGEFYVMENSRMTMACLSESGNPTVDMRIAREVAGSVPLLTAGGVRPANWSYYENDDIITRELTVSLSARYAASSFPCRISASSPRPRAESCTIGPIVTVPVPRTSNIVLTMEPVLTVYVGSPAKLHCFLTVTPYVPKAKVQKTWSTVPFVDPDRIMIPDRSYSDSMWLKAVDVDDDGMIVTCKTVIAGTIRTASSRLRVVPATAPPPTTIMTRRVAPTTPAATEPTHTTTPKLLTISLLTGRGSSGRDDPDITVKSTDQTLPESTSTTTGPHPSQPSLPAVPAQAWFSQPTGIALIVLIIVFIFILLGVIGVAYVKRFSHRQTRKRISMKFHSPRYQNVWSTKCPTLPADASRRNNVITSMHIYHEAGILTDKPLVESTVDRASGLPLVVYAETVVNSLYEADLEGTDRSKTMPCRRIRPSGRSRRKYGNVSSGFEDCARYVTLPNNFVIYSDVHSETTNPYESLLES